MPIDHSLVERIRKAERREEHPASAPAERPSVKKLLRAWKRAEELEIRRKQRFCDAIAHELENGATLRELAAETSLSFQGIAKYGKQGRA